MSERWRRLIDWEMPSIDERHRRWLTAFFALFALVFPFTITFVDLLADSTSVGPGVIDRGQSMTDLVELTRQKVEATGRPHTELFLDAFAVGMALLLLWAGLAVYRGYADYEKNLGYKVPLRTALLMIGVNAATTLPFLLLLALCGLAARALGFSFADGWAVVRHLTATAEGWASAIPMVVELPYPLPLVAAILTVELSFYWFHRLGHTWRPVWLLFHRLHHVPPELTIPMTPAVVVAFPFFFFITIPLTFSVGVATRLFSPETMIMEALLYRLVIQIVAVLSHNSAHYEGLRQSRVMSFLGHLTNGGTYHYLHHSALPEHALVNLGGGGIFFLFWDRVFGTFADPPERKPPVGLTGSPELYANPVRLALAGILQMVYELRMNRGVLTKLKILFGPSDWAPPISRDYAVRG